MRPVPIAKQPAPDTAYRTLIGHTYTCSDCRREPCPVAVRLTRAWRADRR
jgi:hypothetical protein